MKRKAKQLQSIRQEFNAIVSAYYNSIESSFELTLKYFGKMPPYSRFVFVPLTIIFVFCMLPVIPGILNWVFPSAFEQKVTFFSWSFPVDSFVQWWVLLGATSFVFYRVADKVDDKLRDARKLRTLPNAEMPFCLLYASAKEVKAFQLNRHAPHLERAKTLLMRYIDNCEINLSQGQIAEALQATPEATLSKLVSTQVVSLLRKAHEWFQVSDKTALILDGYAKLSAHLLERVSQGIELDRVLAVIEPLSLYEFSRVKRESTTTLTSSSLTISELGDEFLLEFAMQASVLSPLPKQESEKSGKPIESASRKFWSKLSRVLAHENPLTCFIGWYLLLLLVFALPLLGFVKFIMPIDSTILIGLLSAPFAGAIAITTAVYAKRRDKKESDSIS